MDEKARYKSMDYGPIGAAVRAAMPHTEGDPIGVHAAVLALYSAAITDTVAQPDGRPVVVWTVLAGNTSAGKGAAFDAAVAVLKDSIGDWIKSRRKGGIASGPSLVQTLWEREQDSLTSGLGLDGRVVLVDEEWENILSMVKRCPKYSGFLRTAWDGKPISNITKRDGKGVEVTVERPSLGFHAHIQPLLWAEYTSRKDAQGGSYNRLLPVMVEPSKYFSSRIKMEGNPLDKVRVNSSLRLAYEWSRKEPRRITFSNASADHFDTIRDEYRAALEELPDEVSCYFARASDQVLRVACVLTAAERKTVLTIKALNAAKAFVDYSITSVKQLISQEGVRKSRTVAPLDVKIRQKLEAYGGEMTSAQLLRAFSSKYSAAQLFDTASGMADVEIVRQQQVRPGPNPLVYRLVPVRPESLPVEAPPKRRTAAKKAAPPARKTASKKAVAAQPAPRRKTARKAAPVKKAPAKKAVPEKVRT
ncbi:DUF3987 domain-containing protein [Streptomyces sp. 4F14]|uniref:DUF3987 domain-containing protein n=1 Tax=Streptomyces sp. 4F14 TaxID=3394380 RepID=UPI003A84FD03